MGLQAAFTPQDLLLRLYALGQDDKVRERKEPGRLGRKRPPTAFFVKRLTQDYVLLIEL